MRRVGWIIVIGLALTASAPSPAAARAPRCPYRAGALPAETLPAQAPRGTQIPIDHVVVLMQENRSFDHYFGRLRQAGVHAVRGLPGGASNPDADGRRVHAFHQDRYCIEDVAHSWNASHRQFDGGRMDGFVTTNDPDGERAMGYLDESDLPYYYALAKTFAIADRFFCSVLGPTYPNRFYLLAATSDGRIRNDIEFFDRPSIFRSLDAANVSWKAYDGDVGLELLLTDVTPARLDHVRPIAEYYADAAAGTLPAVSFVSPRFLGDVATESDEHPPADPQVGQRFVSSVVGALIDGDQWERSALFLLYDEHGGFYDHVRPPRACEPDDVPPDLRPQDVPARFDRYGFRVPFVAISPWVKPGYVSHETYDHTSVLRFIETRFGLPALTARDANANPLLDLFDFSRPHLLHPPALPEATVDPGHLEQCLADFPPS
jgi:phospholipase C